MRQDFKKRFVKYQYIIIVNISVFWGLKRDRESDLIFVEGETAYVQHYLHLFKKRDEILCGKIFFSVHKGNLSDCQIFIFIEKNYKLAHSLFHIER